MLITHSLLASSNGLNLVTAIPVRVVVEIGYDPFANRIMQAVGSYFFKVLFCTDGIIDKYENVVTGTPSTYRMPVVPDCATAR